MRFNKKLSIFATDKINDYDKAFHYNFFVHVSQFDCLQQHSRR